MPSPLMLLYKDGYCIIPRPVSNIKVLFSWFPLLDLTGVRYLDK